MVIFKKNNNVTIIIGLIISFLYTIGLSTQHRIVLVVLRLRLFSRDLFVYWRGQSIRHVVNWCDADTDAEIDLNSCDADSIMLLVLIRGAKLLWQSYCAWHCAWPVVYLSGGKVHAVRLPS